MVKKLSKVPICVKMLLTNTGQKAVCDVVPKQPKSLRNIYKSRLVKAAKLCNLRISRPKAHCSFVADDDRTAQKTNNWIMVSSRTNAFNKQTCSGFSQKVPTCHSLMLTTCRCVKSILSLACGQVPWFQPQL